MIRHLIRWLASRRAQALIEFALIAPLMFVFLFTMVDFGIALDRRITLQHAVREGARYAAVHTDALDIKQRTVDQAQDILDIADVDVCYMPNPDDENSDPGDPGSAVRVSATFEYDLAILGPVLSGLFGGSSVGTISMTPSGTARLERGVEGAVECL